MPLQKNLIIFLSIAIPLSLIMLIARQLEAAANHGERLLTPEVLNDEDAVEANRLGPESNMAAPILDWGYDLLGYVSLDQTATISADLSISKTGVGASAVAGQTYDYNLTVTNEGPDPSSGGSVNDILPPGWAFVSDTDGLCSFAPGGFTCPVGGLAPGAAQSFTATVEVPAGAQAGTAINRASVSGNEDTDPNNNNASAPTNVIVLADLSLDKIGLGGSAVAGTPYNYLLTVTNHGPSNSSGGSISDTLPLGWTFSSASGGLCNPAPNGFTCTVNPLTVGAAQSFTATVIVPAEAADGLVTNSASVSSNEDPNPLNDNASVETIVTTSADLSIAKTDQPDSVIAGQRLTYTLAIQNNGPSLATGVVVTDDLPSAVNLVSATSTAGTCGIIDPVSCTIGGMNVSDNVTVTIAVDVDPFASGVITNSATVSGDQFDNNPGNNLATAQTNVNRLGQLQIIMSDNPDAVAAGTNLTYTITITNSGPSGAVNVVMTDTLPTKVSFVSAQTGFGDSCIESSLGVLDCSFGNLVPNESAAVEILVFVQPSTFFEQITNEAVVSGKGIPPRTEIEVTDVVPFADLALTKTDNPDPVTAGENLTYRLRVENKGPADAQGVAINDTLPSGVTYQSGSPGCSANGMLVSCDLGTMVVGQVVTPTITVKVNQDTLGSITNSATVLTQSADPISGNNTDVEMTTVVARADLAISKTGTPGTVEVTGTVTYTLAIHNNGPSLATNVDVVDSLPPGVTLVSAIPSKGSCNGTSPVTCNLEDLNANGNASVTLVVDLVSVPPGLLENTASVSSDTMDTDNTNNSDTATTIVFDPVFRLFLPVVADQRFFGEPNDSCETAAPLTLNTVHSFLPEDRDDWYQFDLPSSGNLVVELTNFEPKDGQLTVYFAPDCASRDQDDVIGINGNSATTKVLNLGNRPAGNYFIYVSNDGTPSMTPYNLQVKFTP